MAKCVLYPHVSDVLLFIFAYFFAVLFGVFINWIITKGLGVDCEKTLDIINLRGRINWIHGDAVELIEVTLMGRAGV